MKKNLKIIPEINHDFYLKSISEEDIEYLRKWKNNNRKSFFYQEIISQGQQKKWFDQYCVREDDYIFMVMDYGQNPIGCLGFRWQNEEIDIYNVIRGIRGPRSITMHDAMHTMLAYIVQKYNNACIKCDVLKNNPAVEWYKKCGFDILEEKEYYVMKVNKGKISTIRIIVEET